MKERRRLFEGERGIEGPAAMFVVKLHFKTF